LIVTTSIDGLSHKMRRCWLVRCRSRTQPGDLVLYLQLAFLEAADRIIIGMRPGIFFYDRMLQRSMLGLQRLDVVHSAHRRPPSWLRTGKPLTPQMRRVTPNRAPRLPVHKSARIVGLLDAARPPGRPSGGIPAPSGA